MHMWASVAFFTIFENLLSANPGSTSQFSGPCTIILLFIVLEALSFDMREGATRSERRSSRSGDSENTTS